MSSDGVLVPATVVDSATKQPQIPAGTPSTLTVRLQNATGGDVAVSGGATPSTFAVKLPFKLFTADQLSHMTVPTTGWTATADTAKFALNVAASQDSTWVDGDWIEFAIAGVVSTAQPTPGTINFDLKGFAGANVPLTTAAPIAIIPAPQPGNLKLEDVLEVSLDRQGSVYVSSAADPLHNRLTLNLKNIGTTALSTGDSQPGNPHVQVSFVYGNTAGALAPDQAGHGNPPAGSIWNVQVGLGTSQEPWTAGGPVATVPASPGKDSASPAWWLKPSPSNVEVLGPRASDSANASFDFTEIASFTQPGHTQMIVLCTGFAQSATKAYDAFTYVLDIVKQEPPPTRGLLSFSAPDPVIAISDPKATVEIPLSWAMLDVASVNLVTSRADVAPVPKIYHDPQPLAYDSATLSMRAPATSQPIFATLQAFDGKGGFLNSMQFTAYAQVSYVQDPAGAVYRTARFGDTFWMLQNYDYDPGGGGSWLYDPSQEQAFGRLYDWPTVQAHIPDGWSLPTDADWTALFELFGGGAAAYAALAPGGDAGWDAQLGGQVQQGTFSDQFTYGYYWTGGADAAQFSGTSGTVSFTGRQDGSTGLSARYVRRA